MYSDWPEKMVPDLKAMDIMYTIVKAMSKTRNKFPNSRTIVHCGAGVGRTGTTLACCIIT